MTGCSGSVTLTEVAELGSAQACVSAMAKLRHQNESSMMGEYY